MNDTFYEMIFKRKSFHIFRKVGNESISDEKIRDIVWSEAEDSPLHGWFLELAKQHGIR